MDTIKEFSFNKLLTETTELGRDLKLIRNGCYLLIFVLSICFFIYILSADMYDQMFLQAKAQGASSWIPLVMIFQYGVQLQQLSDETF